MVIKSAGHTEKTLMQRKCMSPNSARSRGASSNSSAATTGTPKAYSTMSTIKRRFIAIWAKTAINIFFNLKKSLLQEFHERVSIY